MCISNWNLYKLFEKSHEIWIFYIYIDAIIVAPRTYKYEWNIDYWKLFATIDNIIFQIISIGFRDNQCYDFNLSCPRIYTHLDICFMISMKYNVKLGLNSECDGISNHQHLLYLLNCLFRCRSKKNQSSKWLAFVRGINWWPVNSPHKGPVMRKMYPFDDVIMFRFIFFDKNCYILFPSVQLSVRTDIIGSDSGLAWNWQQAFM